jgi:hypothetical protein
MTIDKSIHWRQICPFAIRFAIGQTVDECWHAGCVRDVLVPPDAKDAGEVLVATDTGGVWLTRSDGTGLSLSDWDKPTCGVSRPLSMPCTPGVQGCKSRKRKRSHLTGRKYRCILTIRVGCSLRWARSSESPQWRRRSWS